MKTLTTATLASPIGAITVIADADALVGLEFADKVDRVGALREHLTRALGPLKIEAHADPAGAASRLKLYFKGEVGALEHQKTALHGTPFEQKVWRALLEIPVGHVRSYKEIAEAIGSPKAVRAVGAANGHNPVALFVPCHRVVAADGALHGYGGGLERKRWLLEHERAHTPATAARSKQLHFAL
jgi:methylated-DNA-[protein]-cysteine S-methyltransferase